MFSENDENQFGRPKKARENFEKFSKFSFFLIVKQNVKQKKLTEIIENLIRNEIS